MRIFERYEIFLCPLFMLFAFLCLTSCSRPTYKPAPRSNKVPVVVSILPLADLVREVGDDHVEVEVIIPPGSSPHTFEPSPRDLRLLHTARLMVLVGVNLEPWKNKLIDAADNKSLIVLELARGVKILRENEKNELEGNPHIWLSPRNAMRHVEQIRDALIECDPAHRDDYVRNADEYLKALAALDMEIRDHVAQFKEKRFISNHAAWVYFARDYGLDQAGAIETTPGKEPSPQELRALVREVRDLKAKAIFAEPQLSTKAASAIAEECGIKVLFLNYMGNPPDYRYIDMMRYNVEQMEKAMK
jgi:ABC-type Zn uptake system ZnuABC Zn-binding protein ZnuA